MTITQTDIKRLFNFSGNQCAFSGCTESLVENYDNSSSVQPSVIGEIAHIVGRKLNGPRGEYPLSLDERDKYENLILLCPRHHKIIDDNPEKYTVTLLSKWKREHEQLISDATKKAVIRRSELLSREDSLGVYIAYAQEQWSLAKLIYELLLQKGYEPFLLTQSRSHSLDIMRTYIGNATHFITLITKDSLDNLSDTNTKFFSEIKHAIELKRNIINIIHEDVQNLSFLLNLPEPISSLMSYPQVELFQSYFQEGIRRLCNDFLISIPGVKLYELQDDQLDMQEKMQEEIDLLDLFFDDEATDIIALKMRVQIKYFFNDLDSALIDANRAVEMDSKDFNLYIDRGLVHLKLENYEKAEHDFHQASQLNPLSSRAFNNWSLLCMALENYVEAIMYCNKAIELNPNNKDAYLNRSSYYLLQGNYEKAIQDCSSAIKIDDKFLPAYGNRASIYLEKEQLERAIADCLTALEMDETFFPIYNTLGLAYKASNNFEQALEAFDKAVFYSNNSYLSLFNRLTVYGLMGKWSKVIEECNMILDIDEHDAIYRMRGITYFQLGELSKAQDDINKYLTVNSDDLEALLASAIILRKQEEFSQAINILSDVLNKDPKYFDAWHERAITYGQQGKYRQAIRDYTRAIEVDPTQYLAFFNRAKEYMEHDKFQLALEDFNKALDLESNDADIFIDRGMLLFQVFGDAQAGIADETIAIDLSPKNPMPYVNRGIIYLNQDKLDLALLNFMTAISTDPDYWIAHLNLANYYQTTGRIQDAIDSTQTAIKLAPEVSVLHNNMAILLNQLEKFDESIPYAKKAIMLDRKNAEAHIELGIAYMANRKFKDAEEQFKHAAKISPRNFRAFFNLNIALCKRSSYEDALAAINRAISIDSDKPHAYLRRAVCHSELGNYEDALKNLEIAKTFKTRLPVEVWKNIDVGIEEMKQALNQ